MAFTVNLRDAAQFFVGMYPHQATLVIQKDSTRVMLARVLSALQPQRLECGSRCDRLFFAACSLDLQEQCSSHSRWNG